MSQPRSGLGRGLGALLGHAHAESEMEMADNAGVRMLPITAIRPNPQQPRTQMDPEALAELAASIREHGILQPLLVANAGEGRYHLIAGERRWRAAQIAELESVPAIVREASSQELLELALVENLQRADLSPLEEAAAYRTLMDEFGLTQDQVAQRVGRSRVAVANTVRLLRLPETVQRALAEERITTGHARALLGLPDAASMDAALEIVERRQLTVRETEELVRRMVEAEVDDEASQLERDPETRLLEDQFRTALGTRVSLTRGKRGGRLIIYFYSEEDLQVLYDAIVGKDF